MRAPTAPTVETPAPVDIADRAAQRRRSAHALARALGQILRGSASTEPHPRPPAAPSRSEWKRYMGGVPVFLRDRVVGALRRELARPDRLIALYEMDRHIGGHVGKDAEFKPRCRRRRKSHWTSIIRTMAAIVCQMDIRSRWVAIPHAGDGGAQAWIDVRPWDEVFEATWGEPIHGELGMSRLERILVLLRSMNFIEAYRVHKTDDGGVTFQSKPSYKRVRPEFFQALGLWDAYQAARAQRQTQIDKDLARQRRKAVRREARQRGESRGLAPIGTLLQGVVGAAGGASTSAPPQQSRTGSTGPPRDTHRSQAPPPPVIEQLHEGATPEEHVRFLQDLLKD